MSDTENAVDPTELDRLVDGELTDDEQRRLLERLEESPDGWRRLALTFVEAQTWRVALRDAASWRTTPASAANAKVRKPRSVRANERRLTTSLGQVITVAGFLLVFALGFAAQRLFPSKDNEPSPLVRKHQPSNQGERSGGNDARNSSWQQANDDTTNEEGQEIPSFVQFAVNDGMSDVPRIVEVPILTSWSDAEGIAKTGGSMLSDDVRQWLAQTGHDVEEQSGYWPVTLPNGRQVVIPVSQVRVNYSGLKFYQ